MFFLDCLQLSSNEIDSKISNFHFFLIILPNERYNSMKYILFILTFILITSCSKDYPIISGKVNFISNETGINYSTQSAMLNLYEYQDDFNYDTLLTSKSLYRTTTNAKGTYRIKNIQIGSYLVILQATIENKNIIEFKRIDVERKKNYQCDFQIKY